MGSKGTSRGTYHQYTVHPRHHQILVQLASRGNVSLCQMIAESVEQPEMRNLHGQTYAANGISSLCAR
jgi:hypothetical protein